MKLKMVCYRCHKPMVALSPTIKTLFEVIEDLLNIHVVKAIGLCDECRESMMKKMKNG